MNYVSCLLIPLAPCKNKRKKESHQTLFRRVKENIKVNVLRDVNSDQAGHVGEVAVPQRCDEVVHQPELRSLPVNVGWYKKEARLGTQHRVGRHQVLAGAAFRTQHRRQGGVDGGQEDKEEGEEERAQMRGDGIHVFFAAATKKEKRCEYIQFNSVVLRPNQ